MKTIDQTYLLTIAEIGERLVTPIDEEHLTNFIMDMGYLEYDGKTYYPTARAMQDIEAVYVENWSGHDDQFHPKMEIYFSADFIEILQDMRDPETGTWY